MNLLSRTFRGWVEFCSRCKTKRQTVARLKQDIEEQLITIQEKVFQAWKSISKRKIRNRTIIENARVRRTLRTCSKVFNLWGREVQVNLRKQMAELTQRYRSLEKDVKENEDALQEADNEKLLFSEREEGYLQQIEGLKKELEKKNAKIVMLLIKCMSNRHWYYRMSMLRNSLTMRCRIKS